MEKDEDLEFASKEDLEMIKTNPQLARVHQAMLAGVNKKFQEYSSNVKRLQSQLTSLQEERDSLDSGLTEWENWYKTNKTQLDRFGEYLSQETNQPKENKGRGQRRVEREDESDDQDTRYNQLLKSMESYGMSLRAELNKMGKMVNLSMQLNDLYRRHPDLDPQKVLDVALKKGYSDLHKAYEDEDAYGKEILKKKVDEALEPRLKEELAKRTLNVETGSGSSPITFELPKELPKSMAEAGAQFLKERSEQANNPPPSKRGDSV